MALAEFLEAGAEEVSRVLVPALEEFARRAVEPTQRDPARSAADGVRDENASGSAAGSGEAVGGDRPRSEPAAVSGSSKPEPSAPPEPARVRGLPVLPERVPGPESPRKAVVTLFSEERRAVMRGIIRRTSISTPSRPW
ncbi:MAG: hypothetical protein KGN77_02070 [Xanthomonadaceae bacterium]|nr:hypothetical protein [Xanthomonadaceae bacterium]